MSILDVQDAGAADFLYEICDRYTCSSGHLDVSRSTIKDLLLTLSTCHLIAPELDERFQQLARMELVPVRKARESKFSAGIDEDWFIPDRLRLANRFEGKLWVLDFEKEEVASLKALFVRMGVLRREISCHVTEETITEGACAAHPQITKELRAKAVYIAL